SRLVTPAQEPRSRDAERKEQLDLSSAADQAQSPARLGMMGHKSGLEHSSSLEAPARQQSRTGQDLVAWRQDGNLGDLAAQRPQDVPARQASFPAGDLRFEQNLSG